MRSLKYIIHTVFSRTTDNFSLSGKKSDGVCDSRSDYHSWENRASHRWERFPYLAPIFGLEYLSNPTLTERLQTLLKNRAVLGRFISTL